ncbi:MAG TPA: hypothetical protein VFC93_22090 [Chloroflexota bacterium]|nr:hypothetical protein [Chloroflexota bacterium]
MKALCCCTALVLGSLFGFPLAASAATPTSTPAATASPAPSPSATVDPSLLPSPTPDNSTPKSAIPVQPDQVVSGYLEGDKLGKFAYYKFDYKGDGSTVNVDVEIQPDDILVLKSAGFKVLGPNPGHEYARGGVQKGMSPNVSGNVISREPGTYVIQVFNFNPSTPIGFGLVVSGPGVLPIAVPTDQSAASGTPAAGASGTPAAAATAGAAAAASPAPAAPSPAAAPAAPSPVAAATPGASASPSAVASPAAAASPGAAPTPAGAAAGAPAVPSPAAAGAAPAAASAGATPTPVGAAASSAGASGAKGHLEKGPDGHFAFFQLDYPGKRAVYTIDVRITPESSVAATWAGFRVYGPEKNRIYVRGGPQLGLPWNVSGNLIADAPGTYVVQVFNYDPNTGVDYELRLTSD